MLSSYQRNQAEVSYLPGAIHPVTAGSIAFQPCGPSSQFFSGLWSGGASMSELRSLEWRELCLKALNERGLERRKAVVLELSRIVHKEVYSFGALRVDVRRARVTRNGRRVHLTNLEFKLLQHFVERPGTALTRDALLRTVWGYHSHALTRTLDVHVSYLRRKLEQDRKRPKLIVTVPHVGYKFLGFQSRTRSA